MKRLNWIFLGGWLILTGACNETAQKDTEEILVEDSIRSAQAAEGTDKGVRDIKSSAVDNKPQISRQAFPNLSTINPLNNPKAYVYFNPKHTEVINQWEDVPAEADIPSDMRNITAIKTRIDSTRNDVYTVAFNAGPSNDPAFIVYQNDRELLNVGALEIVLPGNGLIYTAGHTNNMFDQRRVYHLDKGRIREIEQPFLYVGLQTKAAAPLTIYTDTRYRNTIAHVPQGSEVTVLLNQGNDYLIKDAFGVVGWWKGQTGRSTPFQGLEYAGD